MQNNPQFADDEQNIIDLLRDDPDITNTDIAHQTNWSVSTVPNKLTSIYRKLGFKGRAGRSKRHLLLDWIQQNQ